MTKRFSLKDCFCLPRHCSVIGLPVERKPAVTEFPDIVSYHTDIACNRPYINLYHPYIVLYRPDISCHHPYIVLYHPDIVPYRADIDRDHPDIDMYRSDMEGGTIPTWFRTRLTSLVTVPTSPGNGCIPKARGNLQKIINGV